MADWTRGDFINAIILAVAVVGVFAALASNSKPLVKTLVLLVLAFVIVVALSIAAFRSIVLPPQPPPPQSSSTPIPTQAQPLGHVSDRSPGPDEMTRPRPSPSGAQWSSMPTPSISNTNSREAVQQEIGHRLLVVADDESGSAWTKEITAREIENAFVQSPRFDTVLRSSLRKDLREALDQSDIAQTCQEARQLNIKYIIVGKCLQAKQENFMGLQSYLNVVVQIQVVDTETGQSIHSRGFKGKELTKTLVVGASREPKAVYSQMMERFAREFLNGLNNLP